MLLTSTIAWERQRLALGVELLNALYAAGELDKPLQRSQRLRLIGALYAIEKGELATARARLRGLLMTADPWKLRDHSSVRELWYAVIVAVGGGSTQLLSRRWGCIARRAGNESHL